MDNDDKKKNGEVTSSGNGNKKRVFILRTDKKLSDSNNTPDPHRNERIISTLKSIETRNLAKIIKVEDDNSFNPVITPEKIENSVSKPKDESDCQKLVLMLNILDGLETIKTNKIRFILEPDDLIFYRDRCGYLYVKITNYWRNALGSNRRNSGDIYIKGTIKTFLSVFWDEGDNSGLKQHVEGLYSSVNNFNDLRKSLFEFSKRHYYFVLDNNSFPVNIPDDYDATFLSEDSIESRENENPRYNIYFVGNSGSIKMTAECDNHLLKLCSRPESRKERNYWQKKGSWTYTSPFKPVLADREIDVNDIASEVLYGQIRLFEAQLKDDCRNRRRKESSNIPDLIETLNSILYLCRVNEIIKKDKLPIGSESIKRVLDVLERDRENVGKKHKDGNCVNEVFQCRPKCCDFNSNADDVVGRILDMKKIFVLKGTPGSGEKIISDVIRRIYSECQTARVLLSAPDHEALGDIYKAIQIKGGIVAENSYIINESDCTSDSNFQHSEWRKKVLEKAKENIEVCEKELEIIKNAAEYERLTELVKYNKERIDSINMKILEGADEDVSSLQMARDKYIENLLVAEKKISSLSQTTKPGESEERKLEGTIRILNDWVKVLGDETNENAFLTELPFNYKLVAATCKKIIDYLEYPAFDWVIIDNAGIADPLELLTVMTMGYKILLVEDNPLVFSEMADLQKRVTARIMDMQENMAEEASYTDFSKYKELTEFELNRLNPFEYLYANLQDSCKCCLEKVE